MAAIVHTISGAVRGQLRDGVTSFLGIPYAASPTGPLRLREPSPPTPWDGVRDADAFGATPPKPGYPPPFNTLLYEPEIPGDDWLTVNVWTPEPGGAGLPVMVWIYGGAFRNGSSAIPVYDGHAFARDGVVLVSFNYRLGVEGFGLLSGAPPNRGLLDQVAALEWVRDNIAAFGGDPGNVTIFGESAGAMSVISLMSMPRARGLFAKAIAQSGAGQAAADPADAALVAAELGGQLGMEPTAANLAVLPISRMIDAQRAVAETLLLQPDPERFGRTVVASGMAFIPVVDGDILPEAPVPAIRSGASADVPVLTGTTTEEYRFFLAPIGLIDAMENPHLDGIAARYGIGAGTIEAYRSSRPGASPGDLLAALITDSYFRNPALAVAEARAAGPAPTYLYEFAWRTPVRGLGACHALELGFVFDTLGGHGTSWLAGSDPPQALADRMHATWVRFAAKGDPGWVPFDTSYPVMVFDHGGDTLSYDPRSAERRAWR